MIFVRSSSAPLTTSVSLQTKRMSGSLPSKVSGASAARMHALVSNAGVAGAEALADATALAVALVTTLDDGVGGELAVAGAEALGSSLVAVAMADAGGAALEALALGGPDACGVALAISGVGFVRSSA